MENGSSASIEHVFSKSDETLKKGTGKQQKGRLSSKKSDVTDDLSAQINNSNFDESSSIAASIQNLDSGGDSEMDLSLDCGNKNTNVVSLDDQNDGKITPKNTFNVDNSTMDSNQSRSGNHRLTHAPSNASRASVSDSGGSRSGCSRSKSSSLSSTYSTRSNSSRSRSNPKQSSYESIKSPRQQSRFQSRSPSKRQRVNRSSSTDSTRFASNRLPPSKPIIKNGGSSNSGLNNTSSNTNDRPKLIRSNGNAKKSNDKGKSSVAGRSISSCSNRSRPSDSHSKSNRHRSRSRSWVSLTKTVSQNKNHTERRQQFHADIRPNRGQKTSKSSINGKHESLSSRSKHRRSSSDYSRSRSRRSFSSQQSRKHEVDSFHRQKNISTASKCDSNADLMNVVQKLTDTIRKNNQQLKENDRRLHRMELTVNKIFVLVGDLNGNTGPILDELANDQGFEIPKLPIETTNELAVMKRKLKDKEFRDFFVSSFITSFITCFIETNRRDSSSSTKRTFAAQQKNPPTP